MNIPSRHDDNYDALHPQKFREFFNRIDQQLPYAKEPPMAAPFSKRSQRWTCRTASQEVVRNITSGGKQLEQQAS
jgi:hypothetical protein